MRLARKLTVVLVLGVFAVLAVYAWVTVQRVLNLFDVDQRHDATLMGRALGTAVAEAWRTRGEDQALKVVQHANVKDGQLKVRWVWLDAQVGEKHHPMAPLEALEPVALGKDVSTISSEEGGGYFYTYIPVRVPGPRKGALELSESLARKREFVQSTLVNAVIATGVVAAVCGVLAMLLGVWFVGRPVRSWSRRRVASAPATSRAARAADPRRARRAGREIERHVRGGSRRRGQGRPRRPRRASPPSSSCATPTA